MRRLLVVFTASLLASFALAQGTSTETGALTAIIGGEERLLHSYAMYVPEDVADGVEDPQQRAILERVAGTEQHTATYMFMEGMSLGGMVLTPDTIWVALTFRFGGPDAGGPHGVLLQFPLDPATLALLDPDQVEISYYPNGSSYDDYYALTAGAMSLDFVEVVDDVTLRIMGTFSGFMTHQTEYDVVHDEASAIEARGDFLVDRVVGSALALELVEEAAD